MENKLWYNEKDKTLSLNKKNWIKANNSYKTPMEESFFVFSLNFKDYLIYQKKDFMPIVFKKESETIYQGNFLTIYDNPLIYCEEWEKDKGKDLKWFARVINEVKNNQSER